MVLGKAPIRGIIKSPRRTWVWGSYHSKIGAPVGMTHTQYVDLVNEYEKISKSKEPLGIGLSRYYFISLWSNKPAWSNAYTMGSHPFFIPTLLHDFELISDKLFSQITKNLSRDKFALRLYRLFKVTLWLTKPFRR